MKRASGMSNMDIIRSYVSGDRPFIQVGYDSNLDNANRKDGEEWVDSLGRKWEYKNGYKRRISNKGKISTEKRCVSCNMDTKWGNYLDDQVWPKTGLCYDCFIDQETKRKIDGSWKIHDDLRNLKNTKSMIIDMKDNFEEAKQYCEENQGETVKFLEEDGSEEKWLGKEDFSKILDNINGDLEMIYERLKDIDKDIEDCESKLKEHESSKS